MRRSGAPLYSIKRDGSLKQFPRVSVSGNADMPSQGALSNPNDKALVQDLEDKMIDAYVPGMVEILCKAEPCGSSAGNSVDLSNQMIRDGHAEALCEAVNKYEVEELALSYNQLGVAGAEAIAAMLRTNRSLTDLYLVGNKIGDAGKKAVREAVEGREGFSFFILFLSRARPKNLRASGQSSLYDV